MTDGARGRGDGEVRRASDPSVACFGLVVPLYNEAPRFDEFGHQLVGFIAAQPAGSELIFVDDGSDDATARLVDELIAQHPRQAVSILRRPHVGKGAAVAAGLAAVTSPWAAFCDVDLSTPLDQLARVVHAAQRADVLSVGSRDLAGSTLVRPEGPVREALGRAYNRLLQATITPGVVDTQCGAKAASRRVWDAILPEGRETGYAWDAEAIALARARGIPVLEVPIEWRHDDRSKVNVGRDGAAMVVAIPRIWRNARRVHALGVRPAAGEVFDQANADMLREADSEHWWFRSKAALVATAIRRVARPAARSGWLADVGAGSGGVTARLGWDPGRLMVIEGNEVLVHEAHRRHGLHGLRAHVDEVPLGDDSVDVVCLLDVLEHLADPVAALREATRVLRPEGRVVINVPAHEWLWSDADEFLGHVRRYTRRALHSELVVAGLEPRLVTHVFSWLVPPVWVKRRASKSAGPELGLDQTSPLIDRVAMVLTLVERQLVGRVTVPVGTSILAVARKPAA
ncbi:MAG TPA: glycosyltransferase [Acidimicrobiia bacterium]|nr:glycosyltransferase [Acidimicrobiia bacterium]